VFRPGDCGHDRRLGQGDMEFGRMIEVRSGEQGDPFDGVCNGVV
jgi:hypothetical protein